MIKNLVSKFAGAIVSFLIALAMSTPATAQEATFVVKQSVAIPNAVLTPGTYVFKQIGTMGAVAVTDVSGKRVALFLTIPAAHEGNAEKAEITLAAQKVQSIHFATSDLNLQFQYPAKSTETAKNKVQTCPAAGSVNGI